MEMCLAIIDFLADLGVGKRFETMLRYYETKVFGEGRDCRGNKFDENYASNLQKLAEKMMPTSTAVANINSNHANNSSHFNCCLASHYIPQAEDKHYRHATKFIQDSFQHRGC